MKAAAVHDAYHGNPQIVEAIATQIRARGHETHHTSVHEKFVQQSCLGTPAPIFRLLILAPLRIERRALRRGIRSDSTEVMRTGMGPKAAARVGEGLTVLAGSAPVAVAGFCGGLRSEIRPGDVIVATEIRGPGPDCVLSLPSAAGIAEALRATGLTVYAGPMAASERVAFGGRRAQAAADGSLGVDMESYWLLEKHLGRQPGMGVLSSAESRAAAPVAVVRAVSDTASGKFLGGMLPAGWLRAYRSLVRVAAGLESWADSAVEASSVPPPNSTST